VVDVVRGDQLAGTIHLPLIEDRLNIRTDDRLVVVRDTRAPPWERGARRPASAGNGWHGWHVWRIGPTPLANTLPGRLGARARSAQSIRGLAAVNGPGLIRMWSRWSALGPHGTNHWSLVGTSGHRRHATIPGHSTDTPRTREAGTSRRRVRTPPDGCRGPAALASRRCRDQASPAAEPMPTHPGPSTHSVAAHSNPASPEGSGQLGRPRQTQLVSHFRAE
jgi:hypothetical protein